MNATAKYGPPELRKTQNHIVIGRLFAMAEKGLRSPFLAPDAAAVLRNLTKEQREIWCDTAHSVLYRFIPGALDYLVGRPCTVNWSGPIDAQQLNATLVMNCLYDLCKDPLSAAWYGLADAKLLRDANPKTVHDRADAAPGPLWTPALTKKSAAIIARPRFTNNQVEFKRRVTRLDQALRYFPLATDAA
jgi:hypothetical protein